MDAAKLARYRVLRTQAASMSGDVLLARTQELYDLKPSDEDMQRYANTIDNELKAQGIDVVKPLKDIAAVYIHEALETPDGAQAFAAMRSINIPAREKASTAYESRGRLAHAFPSQWEPSEENHGDEPPPIPMDAIKAQTGFHLGVVRYIMLYGRGSYDYRIVPSLDMQMNLFVSPRYEAFYLHYLYYNSIIAALGCVWNVSADHLIQDCVQKMLDIQNTQEPQLRRQILESPHAWPIQMLFDVYIAGARKVGLSLADVARQFMHE